MIKNLRLLKRGLEADVEMGCDKWGAKVWCRVTIPLAELETEMQQLIARFSSVAVELADRARVEQEVRDRVDAMRAKVIKDEKARILRDATRFRENYERDLARARDERNHIAKSLETVRTELATAIRHNSDLREQVDAMKGQQ